MILTAARTDSTYAKDCGSDVASSPPTVTTEADGTYRLLVEPGTYRLEYEPAAGTVSAMLVEDPVVVAHSAERVVTLPAGALAEGMVVAPADANGVEGPAAACEVRVYAPSRDGAPPELKARARTAVDGRFRAVLPRAP